MPVVRWIEVGREEQSRTHTRGFSCAPGREGGSLKKVPNVHGLSVVLKGTLEKAGCGLGDETVLICARLLSDTFLKVDRVRVKSPSRETGKMCALISAGETSGGDGSIDCHADRLVRARVGQGASRFEIRGDCDFFGDLGVAIAIVSRAKSDESIGGLARLQESGAREVAAASRRAPLLVHEVKPGPGTGKMEVGLVIDECGMEAHVRGVLEG